MTKQISELIAAMMTVIVGYLLYFVAIAIITFVVGFPIGIGVYTITRGLELLFNGA
jgi:hypothetical protein